MSVFDKIADSYITTDKTVKTLFTPPKPRAKGQPFTDYQDYLRKKGMGHEVQEEERQPTSESVLKYFEARKMLGGEVPENQRWNFEKGEWEVGAPAKAPTKGIRENYILPKPNENIFETINREIVNLVNIPVVSVAGVDLSVPDIAGLGTMVYGGYEIAKGGWKFLVQSGLTKAVNNLAKENKLVITPQENRAVVNAMMKGFTRTTPTGTTKFNPNRWQLTKTALESLFKKTPTGFKATPEAENVANQVTKELVNRIVPKLTKFTGTNTGVPGMTQTQAQILSNITGQVPQTAQVGQGIVAKLGEYPKDALWRTKAGDVPIRITGLTGEQNGIKYFNIEGSISTVPENELVRVEPPEIGALQSTTEGLKPETIPNVPIEPSVPPPEVVTEPQKYYKLPTGAKPSPEFEILPPEKPPTPPAGEMGEGEKAIDRIIAQSQEVVKQDRPGVITRFIEKVPIAKQIVEFERPGLKMTADKEKLLVGHVAETAARNEVSTKAFPSRVSILKSIENAFGKDAIHGGKVEIKFLGTPEQEKNPITYTLKDIADNPELYTLSEPQKRVLQALHNRNTELLNYVVNGYDAEIGLYPAKSNGAFLPNVDISENIIDYLGTESRAVASGRAKTRIWATARDRMNYDKTFKPELDVQKLLEGLDNFKASSAGGQALRKSFAGLTRLETMEKTHPALYNKMTGLRKRLQSLQGSLGTLNTKLKTSINDFLNSPTEDEDLDALRDALDVELSTGIRKGMGFEEVNKEINSIKSQIIELRPVWKAANLKPYVFVQEGIYRYFPSEQANLIKEMRKTTNNGLLNFLDNIRATAFSGDLSPVLGVQAPLGVLADPVGSFINGVKGAQRMIKEGQPLRAFSMDALAEDVSQDPEEWAEFFSLLGRAPSGTPKEYAAGFLGKIPGFNKFTEGTYTFVTRQTKNLYDKTWKELVKEGLPELQAKVSAISVAGEIFPLVSPSRLGQSQARASLLRAIPTSYSFIRQPANMMYNAAKGFAKLGTLQKFGKITPKEKLSMKLMASLAATVLSIAAVSAYITAKAKGQDEWKAVWGAINPASPNFATLQMGDFKIPIGGPYRGLVKAIFPQEFAGSPIPIPFGGIVNYAKNRLNPVVGMSVDLLQNKDYYGKQIIKGDFPENLLRGMEYILESSVPLTLGTVMESARQGKLSPETALQVASQFAGVNLSKINPISTLRQDWKADLDSYNSIPTDPIEVKANKLLSREDFRKKNPQIDAELFITGQVSSVKSSVAARYVRYIIEQNGIDPTSINSFVNWQDEQKRLKEAGLRDTNITDTDRLMQSLIKYTKSETQLKIEKETIDKWMQIKSQLTSKDLIALNKLWYQNGSLTEEEVMSLNKVFKSNPLEQTNFNTWLKQTLRQAYENTLK